MLNKKTKKIFLFILAAIQILALNAYPVFASIRIPSPSQVAAELERRYHMNLGSMQNMGENFNVGGTKGTAPEVMLFFNPSDPKAGESLTAKASPMYFSNQNEALYYTWYLRHGGCDLNNNPNVRLRDRCDRDGDGDITENDWKIEAMKIIAQGNFDPGRFNYGGNFGNDGDGYDAVYGGDNKKGSPDHCYIHDFNTGINAELDYGCRHFFADPRGFDTGDGSFNSEEEEFWGVDPTDPDTADTGNFDEANVSGLGRTEFTWIYQEGDKVGVVVEGTSMNPTKYDDSSAMIMWALPKNKCTRDTGVNTVDITCPAGSLRTATCVNTTETTDIISSMFGGSDSVDGYSCISTSETPVCVGNTPYCSNGLPRCVYAIKDGGIVETSSGANDGYDHSCDDSQEINGAGDSLNLTTPTCVSHSSQGSNVVKTGSKTVTVKGYRVVIPTTNIDINDCLEANLVDPREGGQGTKLDISLSYSPDAPVNDPTEDNSGDKLSVQSSISNADQSAQYYKWTVAISRNGEFSSDSRDYDTINDALIDNKLVGSPLEGNNIENLDIQLNFSADSLGVSENRFSNYFENDIGYLMITAEASENFSDGVIRYGKNKIIVKIINSDKKIKVYQASINSNGTLRIDEDNVICETLNRQDPICYVTPGQIIGLRATESDLENFYWTLNGESLSCDSRVSTAHCNSTSSTNYNFFPVTGKVGDTYVINLTANDIPSGLEHNNDANNDGKDVTLIRKFQVVKPYLSVESVDSTSTWQRWLGVYKDLDGNEYDDLSKNIFETHWGNQIGLRAVFHPASIERDTAFQWNIDGIVFPNLDNTRTFTMIADKKDVGGSYSFGIKGLYSQRTEARKAMKNIWDITEFESEEQYLNSVIQVEVVEGGADMSKIDSPKKFFATVIKAVPENVVFMMRLVLTVGIIIFVSGLIFSLNLNKNRIYEEEKYH